MADLKKYAGGTFISDFKSQFSTRRPKRTVTILYGVVSVFIAFTIFLAFSPSSNSSSIWFTSILNESSTNNPVSSSTSSLYFSEGSCKSQFSSVYCYFFPRTSSSETCHKSSAISNEETDSLLPRSFDEGRGGAVLISGGDDENLVVMTNNGTNLPQKSPVNQTGNAENIGSRLSPGLNEESAGVKNQIQYEKLDDKNLVLEQNHTQEEEFRDKLVDLLKANQSIIAANKTENASPESIPQVEDAASSAKKGLGEKGDINNLTSSLMKEESDENTYTVVEQDRGDLIRPMMACDLFDGNWVSDESYPLYMPGSCSLVDEQFSCFLNGRPDNGYYKMRWKPKSCSIPRLNGTHMLEILRGKRLVFVGDSLNRNMWESLICILKDSVKDQKKVYEEFGRQQFRAEAAYAFVFEEYNCRVEFFAAPFLVQEWEFEDKNGTKKETLRLDLIAKSADKFKNADIIVFNTGHWWTHEKTSKGQDYYQEGSHVYSELNANEAFRKALTTWGRWVDANVDPNKSLVFFRGYSASHFSGGQWHSGGQCDSETEPITNEKYLTPYPTKMTVVEQVLEGMKTRTSYLNVTRMTDYRKDGHPSIYRKQHLSDVERKSPLSFQDCSHWCLPGVPDAWNEILYAQILVKLHQRNA